MNKPGNAHRLSTGTRVGGIRYSLKRQLGRGALSEVWLAWDRTREADIALKFLPPSLVHDATLLEVIRQEIQRVQPFDHPAAVRILGLVEDDEHPAIAMEYVEGWSLAALKVDRPGKRFTLAELTPWIREICGAVKSAHDDFSLLHRDLKPANLLLNAREQVRITDFGVAQAIRSALVRQGVVPPGAPVYFSPQQIKGAPPSKLDDIYSLGATIFELVTGTPPFYTGEILAQICEMPAPKMSDRLTQLKIEETLPDVWEEAVGACLAKDAAKRPQSAEALLKILERPAKLEAESKSEPVVEVKAAVAPATAAALEEKPSKTAGAAAAPQPPAVTTEASPTPVPGSAATESPLPEVKLEEAAPESAEPIPSGPARISKPAVIALVLSLVGLIAAIWLAVEVRNRHGGLPGGVARTGGPGSLDRTFNVGLGASDEVRAVAVQTDGKVLIGGRFWEFNGEPLRGLARLNADGTTDTAFRPQAIGAVHAISIDPDGKIVVAGDFTAICGTIRKNIARLQPDGSLDEAFTARTSVNREIRALGFQGSEVVAGGSFDRFGTRRQGRLVRFKSDGTRDLGLTIGSGADRMIWTIAPQPDGKLIVGGELTSFSDQPCGRIVRLNPDGSVDTGFKTGAGADAAVLAVVVQQDEKILVGGEFLSFDNISRPRIVRLNKDGTVDPSFLPGEGPDGGLRAILPQKDSKIVIVGGFNHVQGQVRNGVARLLADGKLDPAFDPGAGAVGGYLWCAAQQGDGKVLVGGGFTNWCGTASGGIARILSGTK